MLLRDESLAFWRRSRREGWGGGKEEAGRRMRREGRGGKEEEAGWSRGRGGGRMLGGGGGGGGKDGVEKADGSDD